MEFEATSWTLIRQCSREDDVGQAALEELCQRYWQPLYSYSRCSGRSAHDAEDDVQSFLVAAVDGELFSAARQDLGKLRSFLLTAFKRHMIDDHRRSTTAKRGGTSQPLSFNRVEADFDLLDDTPDPEIAFDRSWAMRTVETALEALEARYEARDFEAFRPFLLDTGDVGYTEAAEAHGISVSGFKVGVHRIRKRFREELEKVVAVTIDEGDDLSEEMSYLLEILSQYQVDGRQS